MLNSDDSDEDCKRRENYFCYSLFFGIVLFSNYFLHFVFLFFHFVFSLDSLPSLIDFSLGGTLC